MSKVKMTLVFKIKDIVNRSRDEEFINYRRQARRQVVVPKKYRKEKYKVNYLKEV